MEASKQDSVSPQEASMRMDAWVNALTKLGTSHDKNQGVRFHGEKPLMQEELDELYQSNGLARLIVDAPIEDAFRKGFDLVVSEKPEQAEILQERWDELNATETFKEAFTIDRLHGGALLLVGAMDGFAQDALSENVKSVDFLNLFDRWQCFPHTFYRDPLAKDFNKPESYRIQPIFQYGASGMVHPNEGQRNLTQPNSTQHNFVVHESRCIRFGGEYTPQRLRMRNWMWGDSSLQSCFSMIRDFGIAVQSGAGVLQEFVRKVFKFKGLENLLAAGNEDLVRQRIQVQEMMASIWNVTLIGDGEEYNKMGTPVTGLAEIMMLFHEYVAMVSRIPVSRLFGNKSGSLGSSAGETDLQNYYDDVVYFQTTKVKPAMMRLLQVLCWEQKIDFKTVDLQFKPLREMTEMEKADLRLKQAQTDMVYLDRQVVFPEEIAESRFGGTEYSTETVLDTPLRNEIKKNEEENGSLFDEPRPEETGVDETTTEPKEEEIVE
jgi:phage-related protein (TIGR01555 family)